MKLKSILFLNVILALSFLTGCAEGESILGKINELLDQQLESGNNESDEQDNHDKEENRDGEKLANQLNNDIDSMQPETYESDQGDEIEIAYGAKAFASSVVEYVPGDPAPTDDYSNPETAVGEPDYDESTWDGFVSLGGGGHLILEFEEVYLIDGPGDDLQIFEIGPAVEALEIEISKDGIHWINVGEISGGTASVDIGPHISDGDKFSYVKLIDLYTDSGGETPGADIDAVVVISAILK